MVKISVLADNLKTMSNAEKRGRRQVMLRPSSKVVVKFLQQMMKHGMLTRRRTPLNRMARERSAVEDREVALWLAGLEEAAHTHVGLCTPDFEAPVPQHGGAMHSDAVCSPMRAMLPPRAGYIGEFEIIDDHRSGKIVVELIGRINKCGVISPRYDVQVGDIEQWVVNLLPSRQFGKIILTTSMGIMDHDEARRRGTGGKIIGFFY